MPMISERQARYSRIMSIPGSAGHNLKSGFGDRLM